MAIFNSFLYVYQRVPMVFMTTGMAMLPEGRSPPRLWASLGLCSCCIGYTSKGWETNENTIQISNYTFTHISIYLYIYINKLYIQYFSDFSKNKLNKLRKVEFSKVLGGVRRGVANQLTFHLSDLAEVTIRDPSWRIVLWNHVITNKNRVITIQHIL